jgi:LPXTG-site transpeptidase (sortase) family protein
MSDRPRIGLDNPAFRGRLRQATRPEAQSLPARSRSAYGPRVRYQQDVRPIPKRAVPGVGSLAKLAEQPQAVKPALPKLSHSKATVPVLQIIAPQPYDRPAYPKQQKSKVLQRQIVRPPQSLVAGSLPSKPSRPKLQLLLVGMAGFVFLIGLFVSFLTLQTNRTAKAQVAALSKNSQQADGAAATGAPPSETKPTSSSVAGYQVAPDLPKYIKLAKFGTTARIRPMSVNDKNELQAPASIYDAGWYNASARPGAGAGSGAILIDGHVHGPTLPGIFANIKTLQAGDEVQIVRGDNQVFKYTVVKTQTVDANNLNIGIALASAKPGVAGLNLITCGGPYNRVNGEYTQRTIVFAVLKS